MSPDQIPSWFGDLTIVELLGALLVFAGLWRLGKRAWDVLNRIDQTRADLLGEPARPGVERRKGVVERLHDHDKLLQDIKHELLPNGGGSLRDAVDKVLAAQHAAAEREKAHHAANVARLDALEEKNRKREARERAYVASLHELGLDIQIPTADDKEDL